MKIIILYNQDSSGDAVVADSVNTARAIAESLATLGHQTKLLELVSEKLPKIDADVIFNQAWGIGADENSEKKVAQILERTGIPYTGADARAINLTSDKVEVKKLLQKAGLPTPKFQVVILKPPFIVKPISEDCSIGISQGSIYQEKVFVEEFITGRELNATVLGDQVLPISEITFGTFFKDKYKIVDYEAKWNEQSEFYKQTIGVCPAKLTEKERSSVTKLAKEAFELTHCRDYARIDFRLSTLGLPYILEVNVNPAIGPDDGAVRSARAAGFSYAKFLEKVVKLAYERRRQAQSPQSR